MNDILESTVTGLSDFHRSGLPLEHDLDNYHTELNLLNIDLPTITTFSEPMFDNQQDVYDSQLQIEYSNFFELSDSSSQSKSDTTEIRCSLIDDDSVHNHPMDNNIKSNAPRYYRLTDKMINKVELYYKCNVQP
ncbi:3817_t:CDS:2, partial [Gigaspora margarita]